MNLTMTNTTGTSSTTGRRTPIPTPRRESPESSRTGRPEPEVHEDNRPIATATISTRGVE